ncbi:hypothetical protein KPY62_10655 [Psychrobacter sp. TAE2020]|uniref:hypothetical protein n=1 Tax=Psychrobacter sp. TAE2020 TaxID=2846762 RepID=UPI001C11E755|nr:hypothetical protein [Psychrobacter sp. TAE2020]MBU5617540.1 hypothetical protein [Psychrobacter sp. TAE2020]
MDQIIKHSFEAVSLLTTDKGRLDVTLIPAQNQPDWLIPSSLILSINNHQQWTDRYWWQQQQLPVFHLQMLEQAVDKIIILEGNTAKQRIALQTAGELRQIQLCISEVRDIVLPQNYQQTSTADSIADSTIDTSYQSYTSSEPTIERNALDNNSGDYQQLTEENILSYLFQTVMVDEQPYLIADLDKIAHQLLAAVD